MPVPIAVPLSASISTTPTLRTLLGHLFHPAISVDWSDPDMAITPLPNQSAVIESNQRYFDEVARETSGWAGEYSDSAARARWQAAMGSWTDRTVVEIGCGPGYVFRAVGGAPKLLIGVDVSKESLRLARAAGYSTVFADAQALPFVPGFADIVVVNATLHHCEDMAAALSEAARLLAPGGILITDHDPQFRAWNFHSIAKWAWDFPFTRDRLLDDYPARAGGNARDRRALQPHHWPGEGVTRDLYQNVLTPLGFDVELYPHNGDVGSEVFGGQIGRARAAFRWAQRFSGVEPGLPQSARWIMCRAWKRNPAAAPAPVA